MQSAADLDSNNLWSRLFLPIADLLNCPRGVLGDQWLWFGCRAFERWKVGWIAHITQRDTNIAEKSAALYSLYRRLSEKRSKLRLG
jgi:hypothetical protein